MAGSTNQASTLANRAGAAPPRSAPSGAAGGVRRRATGGGSSSGGGVARTGGNSNGMSMLRYYTDDAPGLKITPVVVLVMSVFFIGFVTMLHAVAKIYQYRSS